MKACADRVLASFCMSALFLLSCALARTPIVEEDRGQCYTESGSFADTLYVGMDVHEVQVPEPQLRHLAPYPPAAEGENRIRYRGAVYYSWGMAVRVSAEPVSEYLLVRIGEAEQIPLFIRPDDVRLGLPVRVWAPITETCVFLPYKHESEMI